MGLLMFNQTLITSLRWIVVDSERLSWWVCSRLCMKEDVDPQYSFPLGPHSHPTLVPTPSHCCPVIVHLSGATFWRLGFNSRSVCASLFHASSGHVAGMLFCFLGDSETRISTKYKRKRQSPHVLEALLWTKWSWSLQWGPSLLRKHHQNWLEQFTSVFSQISLSDVKSPQGTWFIIVHRFWILIFF